MLRLFTLILSLVFSNVVFGCLPAGVYSIGPSGNYPSLTLAFSAITTGGGIGGNVVFELQAGYVSTTEIFPIVLPNVHGMSCTPAGSQITIRPEASATGLIISGTNNTAVIDLNGSRNLTIDGRPGGVGSVGELQIVNNSTTGVAIRFINDACDNTVKYCDVQGRNTSSTSTSSCGVISFRTADQTTQQGNDRNVISFCKIHNATGGATAVGIWGLGSTTSTGAYNDSCTIVDCSIFDYFTGTTATSGIKLDVGNRAWTIANNSFYQTTPRTFTSSNTHRGIWIFPNAGGSNNSASGFYVANNSIGGSAPMCGGSPYTASSSSSSTSSSFIGVDIAVGSDFESSVQGNIVRNIALNNIGGGAFTGIKIGNGEVTIGSIAGNEIGSNSGLDSIFIGNNGFNTVTSFGIEISGGTTLNARNNVIARISISNTGSGANSFTGIGVTSGIDVTLEDNTIGSHLSSNGIYVLPNSSFNGPGLTGIDISGGSVTTVASNKICNLANAYSGSSTTKGFTRGISVSGSSSTISGNTIYNLTSSGSNILPHTIGGIYVSSTSTGGCVVSENKIYSLGTTSSSSSSGINIHGIYFSGNSTAQSEISGNLIHSFGVANGNTNVRHVGIQYLVGAANITNNMIRLGINPDGSSINVPIFLTGIACGSTGFTNNILHNSVFIGGSGVGSSPNATYAFHKALGGTYNISNNIFLNERSNSGSGGKHYAIYLASNVFGTSLANNLYFAPGSGGVVGYKGTSDQVNYVPGWISGDYNSISANPEFINAAGDSGVVDLHISALLATPIEGAGAYTTSVADDFDGEIRSSYTPVDIGADAGNFVTLDIAGPGISYTSLSTPTCIVGDRVLSAYLSDASGVATGLNTPRIYYRKGAGTWHSQAGTLISGTNNGGTWDFTIVTADMGGVVAGDVVSYFVVAQDVVQTPNISSSPGGVTATDVNTISTFPSALNSYSPGAILNGVYTVGVGGNYPTITAALNAYNSACLTGPVTFSLISTTYPMFETYPLTVLRNPTASSVNTLTIQPAAGVNVSIDGLSNQNASSVFKLIDAKYVTIDGLNANNSSLTITNNYPLASAVVWLASTPTTGPGCNNIAIRNLTLVGGSNTTYTATGILASLDGALPSLNPATGNDSIIIEGNKIEKCFYGIYGSGTSGSAPGALENWIINENIIGPASSGSNNIGNNGIWLANGIAPVISSNTIRNISATVSGAAGIQLNSSITGALVSRNEIGGITSTLGVAQAFSLNGIYLGNGVTTTRVSENSVSDISNLTTGGGGGGVRGITVNTGSGTGNIVANNMVSNIAGTGHSVDLVSGISIDSCDDVQVYNNSVNLYGSHAGISFAKGSAALYVNSSGGNIDVRNNVLVNSYAHSSSSSAKSYAVYVSSAGSASTFSDIDYNAYFGTGQQWVLGYLSGNKADLTAWRLVSARDRGSVSGLVPFVSNTDLHIDTTSVDCWNINGRGIAIGTVSTDIESEARSVFVGIPTDIGADEFMPASGVIPADAIAIPAVPTLGVPTELMSAGRKIAEISWSGSNLPSSVNLKYFPGVPPAGISNSSTVYSYSEIIANGGSGFNYDIKLYYTDAEQNAQADADLIVIKNDGSWTNVSTSIPLGMDNYGKYIQANGLNSFSLFSLMNGNPLSTTIGLLSGKASGSVNSLSWRSFSEESVSSFEVEHSADGIQFTSLGQVNADGVPKVYEVLDTPIHKGWNFYRLKIREQSNNHFYSNVVRLLNRDSNQDIFAEVFPNPATTRLTLHVTGGNGDIGSVTITGIAGELIRTFDVRSTLTEIPIDDLTPGLYLLKYSDKSRVGTLKFIKK